MTLSPGLELPMENIAAICPLRAPIAPGVPRPPAAVGRSAAVQSDPWWR